MPVALGLGASDLGYKDPEDATRQVIGSLANRQVPTF